MWWFQIQSDAKAQGTLLPESHPATKMVKRIGSRIAAKASDDTGVAGHMGHMKVSHNFSEADSLLGPCWAQKGLYVLIE